MAVESFISRSSVRSALWEWTAVAFLNALLTFPIFYQTYKHFDPSLGMTDVYEYMAVAEKGPSASAPPFSYRLLTPAIVRAMNVLPGYEIETDFGSTPERRKLFFHFLLLNFSLTAATSALLFMYLRGKVRPSMAWAGSLLYLLAFYSAATNFAPLADAACHFFLMAAILCLERNRMAAFVLICLVGVFAKETVLIVAGGWILVHAVGNWRSLFRLVLLLPAAGAYLAFARLLPMKGGYAYYDPYYVLKGVLRIFNPELYTRTFIFHIVLANLPLLVALTGWVWLRIKGTRVPLNRGLWVFAGLLWFGVTIGIGNNAGRLAFMAFPALSLLQARVLQALWDHHRAKS